MQDKPHHLFVVEDDAPLRELLVAYLQRQGLAVTAMASAEEFLRRIHRLRPDLVVLDVTLPGMSGLQACQRLRGEGDRVPIVLLSGRCEEIDRVLGLEIGADDYVAKPFSPRELLARIRAVLRRATTPPGLPVAYQQEVPIGALRFVPATRSLHAADGATRMLSTVEYALLAELASNPNTPISRERLLAVSHARAVPLLPRTVDVAMMRLRKLVEPDPAMPRYLQTVRGHGYMFVPNLARGAAVPALRAAVPPGASLGAALGADRACAAVTDRVTDRVTERVAALATGLAGQPPGADGPGHVPAGLLPAAASARHERPGAAC